MRVGKTDNRESNIELLRILASLAVVILHFNGFAGALEKTEGMNHEVLISLQCISISAVNIFMIISGYFSCKRTIPIGYTKLIRLEIKTIIVFMLTYVITALLDGNYSVKGMVMASVPSTYYVTLYVTVAIFSPYVNLLLNELKNKAMLTRFVITVILIFSVYITCLEELQILRGKEYQQLNVIGINGSGAGYTFVNFLMCYIIGVWIRLDDTINKLSRRKVLFLWVTVSIVLITWYHFQPGIVNQYCNVLCILQAMLVVVYFTKMKMKNSRIINTLAQASFVCFLSNIPYLTRLDISRIMKSNPIIIVLYICAIFIMIFGIAWIFENIYTVIENGISTMIRSSVRTKHEI